MCTVLLLGAKPESLINPAGLQFPIMMPRVTLQVLICSFSVLSQNLKLNKMSSVKPISSKKELQEPVLQPCIKGVSLGAV